MIPINDLVKVMSRCPEGRRPEKMKFLPPDFCIVEQFMGYEEQSRAPRLRFFLPSHLFRGLLNQLPGLLYVALFGMGLATHRRRVNRSLSLVWVR